MIVVAPVVIGIVVAAVSQERSNTAVACTKFQLQQTEIAFTRLPGAWGREWQDMPHNYDCPAEGASFLLLFLLCWLLRQRRKQQLCMPTHVHEHTRAYSHTHSHTHFVLNPCHIEVSNMATSVDGTNHLVSKRLQSPVSTHNCALFVNNKNVVKDDWNSFKVFPLLQVPRPQLGLHVRANKKLPHRRWRQTVKALKMQDIYFPSRE